ncbi:MAG: MalY/PatB family protein [Pseudomonadota bacterium]
MSFDTPFDHVIDRRNTDCLKWDLMEKLYGVSSDDGLAMWVADMDFRPPEVVQDALSEMLRHGIYGYFGDLTKYNAAVKWWSETRHGFEIDPSWILTTNGLVNAIGLCVDSFTKPGEGVVVFSPVYHAFGRVIRAAERDMVELELVNADGRYEMDFAAYDAQMKGHERLLILCSPHNPGGRVWSREELEELAAFARRHDLIIVADEVHRDLTFHVKHVPMAHIDGVADRLINLSATTKTFNIAGAHAGNVIIADPDLRNAFSKRMAALGTSANSFGLAMATAAYSPEGAAWVDDLCAYVDENRKVFDAAVNAIPGLSSMPLEATYLSWVDFSGTGMEREEFTARVEKQAKIAVNHGPTFGKGGESFLRLNIATPRARVIEAADRLAEAFSDLQ